MRKQYHFWSTDQGVLIWDVDRLVELSAGFAPIDVPLAEIRELNEPIWDAPWGLRQFSVLDPDGSTRADD